MRRALAVVSFLAVVALLAVACGEAKKPAKPPNEPGQKLYTLKGRVVGHDAEENSLRLDHEAIPGFMEAMTMDYPVRGAAVATLPSDGSRVIAVLHFREDHYWITDVRRSR